MKNGKKDASACDMQGGAHHAIFRVFFTKHPSYWI